MSHGGVSHRTRNNVGIFSLFGKKDRQQDTAEKDSRAETHVTTRGNTLPRADMNSRAGSKRDAGRATTMKIDAIESEMSSELTKANTLEQGHSQLRLNPNSQLKLNPNSVIGTPQTVINSKLATAEISPVSAVVLL